MTTSSPFSHDPASPNARTLQVYERLAPRYTGQTEALDTALWRAWLTEHVPVGGTILDAGCGWGRDARAFRDAGYEVHAFDGSAAMVAIAQAHLGQPVVQRRFQDLNDVERYDGIWARASLLHLTPDELVDAWRRLMRALRPGGWCYACFKRADGAWWDDQGRYFQGMTEARFTALLGAASEPVHLVRSEISPDAFGRTPDWLNLLVHKTDEPGQGSGDRAKP